ncbi:MAG TPA: hypothetical protein VFW78_00760 [Bacteroidia bacterium]|nr:hypothetical protein [Bacteroidia bacterium]
MSVQSVNFSFNNIIIIRNPFAGGFYPVSILEFNGDLFIATNSATSLNSRGSIFIINNEGMLSKIDLHPELNFIGGQFRIENDELYFRGAFFTRYPFSSTINTLKLSNKGQFEESNFEYEINSSFVYHDSPIIYDTENIIRTLNPNIIHYSTIQNASGGKSIFSFTGMTLTLIPFVQKIRDNQQFLIVGYFNYIPAKSLIFDEFRENYLSAVITEENPYLSFHYNSYNIPQNDLTEVRVELIDSSNIIYNLKHPLISDSVLSFGIPPKIHSGIYFYRIYLNDSALFDNSFNIKLMNDIRYEHYKYRNNLKVLIPLVVSLIVVLAIFPYIALNSSYSNESWNYFSRWNLIVKLIIVGTITIGIGGLLWDYIKYIFNHN